MDPLLLEAVRFGVAILAGGIVAVISSLLAFRYAQRLRRQDVARRDERLRHKLLAELVENIRRLNAAGATDRLPVRVKSSAWDAARELQMPDALQGALADAYAAGDELNALLLLFDATAVALSEARDDDLAFERVGRMGTNAKDQAKAACRAFEVARVALRKLGEAVPEDSASAQEGDS